MPTTKPNANHPSGLTDRTNEPVTPDDQTPNRPTLLPATHVVMGTQPRKHPTKTHNNPPQPTKQQASMKKEIKARVSDFLVSESKLSLYLVLLLGSGVWYEAQYSLDVFQWASFLGLLLVSVIVLSALDS
ncbi:uncharacterized protein METZ01_LOCUS95623 [marine metagenome]|uniref:Uncharacterized protein n=1 Tax=marine metagenome TaxID=408172 RepID=A0A381VR42_9ZZZZ